jgi:sigma-B regulation protein RsbU (phosphoserine phosphatase)
VSEPSAVGRATGRLEQFALLSAIVWFGVNYFAPGSAAAPAALAVLVVSGLWVAVRLVRRLARHSVWRLRNRLLSSYLFIAVVPVLLLLVLGWMGAWVIAAQTAFYLVAAEFNKRIEVLQDASAAVLTGAAGASAEPANRLFALLDSRFPGIAYLCTRPGQPEVRLPAGAQLVVPEGLPEEISGLLVRDGQLSVWAHHHSAQGAVTVVAPLTRGYLADLIPGLGAVTLFDLGPDGERMRLHDGAAEGAAADRGPRGVPAPANLLDLQILWGSELPVYNWDTRSAERKAVLGIHTRIAQVYRVIFSQKAGRDQPLLVSYFYLIAGLFLFFECAALGIGVSITRTITGAVHHLYEGTRRVQQGDFATRIPVRGEDQLAELSQSFNSMTENLERLLVVAKDNERIRADLTIAREVQEQLYPRTVPASATLALTARLHPARSVSGDYYDYQRVNSRTLTMALGDVAGKGISAAILMASVQSALRAQIRHTEEAGTPCSPSAMVSQLNKHLHAHTTPEKYATFWFGVYDETSGVLTYTNAGHVQPLLFRDGAVTQLDVNGMVVGAFAQARYDESTLRLQPGDLLVLYTDGISEPENEYGEMFGEERLIATIERVIERSNEEIITAVFAAVEQWIHSPDANDDMTILLIRRPA